MNESGKFPSSPAGEPKSGRRRKVPRRATPQTLERAALSYLGRFDAPAAQLRRVLMRRVARSARHHGTDRAEGEAAIDGIIERFVRSGLLDDARFAAARARGLNARGVALRAIRARLAEKGVSTDLIEDTLVELAREVGSADLVAATALVRRRRRGPYRAAPERAGMREKDLAALARAGFDYATALRVVDAPSAETLEDEIAADSQARATH